MKVHILTIGDEILIGQIVDTNAAWLGEYMSLNGGEVTGITTVSDKPEDIVAGLEFALKSSDVVLISGGLGPTKDDVTKKTLASFFNLELYFHEETYEEILRIFARFGKSTTLAHKEQCYMPSGAEILKNKMGTAPGMWFNYGEKVVVSMPGVPYEMKYLMENEVLHKLLEKFSTKATLYKTIQTAGDGESRIAATIATVTDQFPDNFKVAFLPNLGKVRIRIGIQEQDLEIASIKLNAAVIEVVEKIPKLVFGYDNDSLEAVLGKLLKTKSLTLSTAESCTGGYLSHLLTSIPGSSSYFKGGIVAYSNEIKHRELKVRKETLQEFGAVSEETVREMVNGALTAFGTDISISISGIAGPTGGSRLKPVGTIWLAIANGQKTETHKLQLGKDRLKNIEYTANFALNRLRIFVLTNYSEYK